MDILRFVLDYYFGLCYNIDVLLYMLSNTAICLIELIKVINTGIVSAAIDGRNERDHQLQKVMASID